MNKKNLERVSLFNHIVQIGLFSSIFAFTSNIWGIRIILERSLHAILFPIAITPDAIASLLAVFSFAKAKNKNLGKTFDLIYMPTKTALVFTAVFAGVSLIAIHSLFLVAIGSGMLYHISLCLYNAYKFLKTPKNSPADLKLKNLYKDNAIKNGISILVGSIVIIGILTTMVFAPYLSASILAIAGIGTATTLVLSCVYALYRHFRQPTNMVITANETTPLDNTLYSQNPPLNSKGYYYRKFRSEQLEFQPNQLTEDLIPDKNFLIREINEKKTKLTNEIHNSEGKIKEFFWPENSKRAIKLDYLDDLEFHLNLLSPEEEIHSSTFQARADKAQKDPLGFFKSYPKKALQSFFHDKGDIEDIAKAAKKHAKNYITATENAQFSNYLIRQGH